MSWPCTFLGGEDKRDVVANLAELGLPFVTSQRESKETFRKERPVKEANDGLFPLSCVDENRTSARETFCEHLRSGRPYLRQESVAVVVEYENSFDGVEGGFLQRRTETQC